MIKLIIRWLRLKFFKTKSSQGPKLLMETYRSSKIESVIPSYEGYCCSHCKDQHLEVEHNSFVELLKQSRDYAILLEKHKVQINAKIVMFRRHAVQ